MIETPGFCRRFVILSFTFDPKLSRAASPKKRYRAFRRAKNAITTGTRTAVRVEIPGKIDHPEF
jgi:hypothetical protein